MTFCNEDDATPSAICEGCGERDSLEALVPFYVATKEWHRVEKFRHPECLEGPVRASFVIVDGRVSEVTL